MTDTTVTIMRRQSRPLEPVPTGVSPVLRELPAIRAVMFDIYGTLLISASGDIDADASSNRPR